MAVNVSVNSRLNLNRLVKTDGIEFFEYAITTNFPEQEDDIIIAIEEGMRLDLVAYEYYGDPVLLWVILQANDIFCYPFGMYIGKRIRLPNRDRVIGKALQSGDE